MLHKKEKENRTQGVRGNKVSCCYLMVMILDDIVHSHGRYGIPWHPMGSHVAAHGIPRDSP